MASRVRRALPDNLDPLVDTLANVVGILVIVIVLTQIELGGALDRLAEVDASRMEVDRQHRETVPHLEASLAERNAALQARTETDAASSLAVARRVLDDLAALPKHSARESEQDIRTRAAEIEEKRAVLATAAKGKKQRDRYAEALAKVPARMVARLPDPEVVRGLESWILVRYGRVYLVDREALFEQGSQAIRRILPDAAERRVRIDEFETAARYLRKKPIGFGDFRWQLQTEPDIRVELEWATRDSGLDRTRLLGDPTWREWLQKRNPGKEFIRFHVWNDSFETYLAVRTAVEEAGFRAGWTGYEREEAMDIGLRFGGPPLPRERSIEVD